MTSTLASRRGFPGQVPRLAETSEVYEDGRVQESPDMMLFSDRLFAVAGGDVSTDAMANLNKQIKAKSSSNMLIRRDLTLHPPSLRLGSTRQYGQAKPSKGG